MTWRVSKRSGERQATNLAGHDGTGSAVLNFADGTTITGTKFAHHDEVLGPEVEAELDANLERVGHVFLCGGRGLQRAAGAVEGQAADVLALHRLGLEGRLRHGCDDERGGRAACGEEEEPARGGRDGGEAAVGGTR
jgi:hypothetical protein